MSERDGGVDVEHQLLPRARAGTSGPGPCPRLGTDGPHLVEVDVVDPFDAPPGRRVGGDRAEQLVLVAKRGQMRQRVAAIGDHHREIRQHPTGHVHRRERLVGVEQCIGPPVGKTGVHGQFTQQRHPGTRHQPLAVSRDYRSSGTPVTLHLRSAVLSGSFKLSQA
jgi:hypothetical protein